MCRLQHCVGAVPALFDGLGNVGPSVDVGFHGEAAAVFRGQMVDSCHAPLVVSAGTSVSLVDDDGSNVCREWCEPSGRAPRGSDHPGDGLCRLCGNHQKCHSHVSPRKTGDSDCVPGDWQGVRRV